MPERDLHAPVPGQMALTPEPARYALLWPDTMPEPGGAKWTRYKLKTRQPCTTCILVLQQHEKRPYDRPPPPPFASSWIRARGGGLAKVQTWHCSLHGSDLKRLDEMADRQNRLRREHGEHLARATRT